MQRGHAFFKILVPIESYFRSETTYLYGDTKAI